MGMDNPCRLCKSADWSDTEFRSMLEKVVPPPLCNVVHRKHWEWAMGMLTLQKMGKLKKDAIALGVGAGSEWPVFWLTNFIKYVVATDLYTVSHWNEASPSMLTASETLAPYPFNRRRLGVMFMNGTVLDFEDETFDIVFSYSSIEHFGSKEAAAKAMAEIERVLKPGGVLSLCTEVHISGDIVSSREKCNGSALETFTKEEISNLVNSTKLKLVDEIDYSQNNEPVVHVPKEALKTPHVVLENDGVYWGSLHLMMVKP